MPPTTVIFLVFFTNSGHSIRKCCRDPSEGVHENGSVSSLGTITLKHQSPLRSESARSRTATLSGALFMIMRPRSGCPLLADKCQSSLGESDCFRDGYETARNDNRDELRHMQVKAFLSLALLCERTSEGGGKSVPTVTTVLLREVVELVVSRSVGTYYLSSLEPSAGSCRAAETALHCRSTTRQLAVLASVSSVCRCLPA